MMLKHNAGEVMPLTEEKLGEYTVKFCRDESYRNTCKHEASGQSFSMPPDEPDQAQRAPSEGLKAMLEVVKKGILGEKAKDTQLD
jgi:sarcosine oxidase / L-pipecolate oxidase